MFFNTMLLALREIRRNIMRSSLTILGVVIGVGAVIAMVTLGNGATEQVNTNISSLGSNLLILSPGSQRGRGPGGITTAASRFDVDDAEAIVQEIPDINAVAPTASSAALAVYGNKNWSTMVTGTNSDYFEVRSWALSTGRVFTDNELNAGKLVGILGATVRDELFGQLDPVGASIRLGKLSIQVIGVLEAKGQSGPGGDQDDTIIMPLRAVQRRMNGNNDVNSIYISAASSNVMTGVQQDLAALMRQRRRVPEGSEDDFNIRNMEEIASVVSSTTGMLTAFLSAVAAVSLLVGGIGIMNIMLVSVTERTREIGIRLAIGALEREVLMQFLVDAVMLASFGGLLGITLGLGGAAMAASFLGFPFAWDPMIALIAFTFSGTVGVIFGYFPARKAARLDPIDALRHE